MLWCLSYPYSHAEESCGEFWESVAEGACPDARLLPNHDVTQYEEEEEWEDESSEEEDSAESEESEESEGDERTRTDDDVRTKTACNVCPFTGHRCPRDNARLRNYR